LTEHLRKSEVISAAKACLQRVHFMSNSLHGLPEEGTLGHDNVNVRTFLAAFLIVHRPNRFEMIGERETL